MSISLKNWQRLEKSKIIHFFQNKIIIIIKIIKMYLKLNSIVFLTSIPCRRRRSNHLGLSGQLGRVALGIGDGGDRTAGGRLVENWKRKKNHNIF